jgi:ketosteroid isomerase-like protein
MPDIRFSKIQVYNAKHPKVEIMEYHVGATEVVAGVKYNQDYSIIVRFKYAEIIGYKKY